MPATNAQIDRSLKKLARKMANWNHVSGADEDREKKHGELFMAAWKVIRKTGHYADYEREIKKLNKRTP